MDVDPSQRNRWSRPLPPLINPLQDTITFQQIDIDSYICEPVQGYNNIIIHVVGDYSGTPL